MDFLKDYSSVPASLLGALSTAKSNTASPYAWCAADTSDCSTDSGGCSDVPCTKDTPSCTDTPSVNPPSGSPGITVLSVDATSVRIRLTPLTGADYYEIAYRPATTSAADYLTTYSTTVTISGLSPNTTYVINYRGWNAGGTNDFINATRKQVTTLNDFTSFDWTYAGLDSSGNPVYGSQKRSGLGIYVTAGEWNELAGLVSAVTGSSVTTVSRGTPISAGIVNTMARALGVTQVSKGETVSAGFFNRLMNAYNALG